MTKFPPIRPLTWSATPGYVAELVVVGAIYLAAAKLSLMLASVNPSASPVWPPTGLALAAVMLLGYRMWPAILIAAFAANLATAGTIETAAMIAAGNTLECLAGAFLTLLWTRGLNPFLSPSGVLKFTLVAVGTAAVTSAGAGIATLYLAGLAPAADLPRIGLTWWLGNLAGALVVTPPVVLWASGGWRGLPERRSLDVLVVLVTAAAVGVLTFSPALHLPAIRGPLAFLTIVPLVWSALRLGPRETATVALVLSGFAVWGAIVDGGPFLRGSVNDSFLMLVMFMITVSVPSLTLSADVAARRRSENDLLATQNELDRQVKIRTQALAQANQRLQSANEQLTQSHDLLADTNVQLKEAQRMASLGSWVWEIEPNRVTWSDQLYEIYGISPDEFGGTLEDFAKHLHPEDRDRARRQVEDALAAGTGFEGEERIVRPNGDVRQLLTVGEVVLGVDGKPVRMIGVCRDITEEKRRDAALREAEQGYRLLVRGVHDYAIFMLDTQGRVRNWNIGAERIMQYSAGEIVGRHFSQFYTGEDRADDVPNHALETAVREGRYEAQGWRVRKDGTQFFSNEVIDAIRGEDGSLLGFAKITRDITAQREAQLALEQTREQLAQAQKMEAIGQLTGGIAHDFNNLLMIMGGHAQLLQRRLSEKKDLQAVDAIRAAASRGEKLTRQLLAFSRRQTLMPVQVNLREHINAVRDMIGASLRGNIELVCDVEDEIWPVEADLGELELALVNIAVNARDAMPNGGKITLSARNVVLQPGSAAGPLEGDFVALAVIDTGGGIPPDVLSRVFEPFFTTKPIGKGTGLGLSQVHGFAHQSGGAVTIKSEEGKGTVVTIYLPRSTAETAEMPASRTEVRSHGTVLMVEDSRDVAEVTATLLEQLDYRTVRAENAAEALRHLDQGIDVDLLLSDIVMPGELDGFGLAKECARRYPQIPILLTSGYSDAAQAAENHFPILRKPYDIAALERALEQTLKRAAAPQAGAAPSPAA